jgi:uncharacterized coiled-coil DUF342 family protein
LQSSSQTIGDNVDKYSKSEQEIRESISQNYQLLSDARDHADKLDGQVSQYSQNYDYNFIE